MNSITDDRLKNFISSRRFIVWYVKNPQELSSESIVEHILNYGDWKDVQELISILGIARVADIFDRHTKRKRINYRPEIVNYFRLYFKKHVEFFS